MADRTEAVIVRRDPVRGPPERRRYEPLDDGGWACIDEVWTGCAWRVRGQERCERLSIER